MSNNLKILHTSDWHLGKKLYKKDRIEEHLHFFKWLLKQIDEKKIDVLIVAGDLFDSPNPSHDAQKILWDFFSELAQREFLTTLIISGNHDSGKILQAPQRFLEEKRIFINGLLGDSPRIIKVKTSEFVLFPYFRLTNLFSNEEINGDELDENFIQNRIENYISKEINIKRDHYRYLIAHHQFGHFNASGTEQGLYLSGVESISLKKIGDFFDYIALGHIHKFQKIQSSPTAYYSGSPIPFRFSESNSKKIIFLEETENEIVKTFIPIPLHTPLVRLKIDSTNWSKKLEKLIKSSNNSNFNNLFLELNLKLLNAQIGLIELIKEKIKKSKLELISLHITPNQQWDNTKENEINELSTEELFSKFYKFKYPESNEVPKVLADEFKAILNEVLNSELNNED